MTYNTHGFSLNKSQINSLRKLGSVKLKHGDLSGPHQLHLTNVQMARVMKANDGKKGLSLKMGVRQHAHHKRLGGSIWDDIYSGIKSVVSNPVVQDIGKIGISALMNKIGGGLHDFLDEQEHMHGKHHRHRLEQHLHGSGMFDTLLDIVRNPIARDLAGVALKHGVKYLEGSGIRSRRGGSFVL